MPRMQALPPMICGSNVMRSNCDILFYPQRTGKVPPSNVLSLFYSPAGPFPIRTGGYRCRLGARRRKRYNDTSRARSHCSRGPGQRIATTFDEGIIEAPGRVAKPQALRPVSLQEKYLKANTR